MIRSKQRIQIFRRIYNNILAENLIKSLARKNLILNQKVRILSRKSLRERIMFYLGTLPKDKNGYISEVMIMKKSLGSFPGVYPMPVLMVAVYDDNGKVNVMNAAWGMICAEDKIALFIDEEHSQQI